MSEAYHFRHWTIRVEMVESLERYAQYGVPVGNFLTAVLSNDLKEACSHADDENLANLPAFAAYLYNEMPLQSQGSPERVKAWLSYHAQQRAAAQQENAP